MKKSYLSGIQEFINNIKGLHASPDKTDKFGEEAKGFNDAVNISVNYIKNFMDTKRNIFENGSPLSVTPAPRINDDSAKHVCENISSFLDGMNTALSIIKKKINNGQITIKH